MPANTTHFKKTVTHFKMNYQDCYLFATAPLRISFRLIGFGSMEMRIERFLMFVPALFALTDRVLGVLSLPVTIAATPTTMTTGLIAALVNTLWGCFALPIAGLRDALRPVSATVSSKGSATSEELDPLINSSIDSSQKMLENMSKGNSLHQDEALNAELPEPSVVGSSIVFIDVDSEKENSQADLTEEEYRCQPLPFTL